MRAFHLGLSEIGYVERQNVVIEYRWAEGQNDRLPVLAAELVRQEVAVIVAPGSTPAVLAAKAATTTIPIVFATGGDPVSLGLVTNLNRPAGNLTGVTSLSLELAPKLLELLHELVPAATVIALLVNPSNPDIAEVTTKSLQAAAPTLGLKLEVMHASTERDFDGVFSTLAKNRAAALVIGTDAYFSSQHEKLAALALRHAIPTIYRIREFAAAGGLASYGNSFTETFRQAGAMAGRILKGAKPAELPVQQSAKLDFVINLKTAKALGLTIPVSLLLRADEVIE